MNFNILLMALGLLGMVSLIREIKNDAFIFFIRQAPLFRIIYCWVLVFLIVISSDLSSKEFIYFQF
ncbi:hypothetical protein [Succinivibrio sp.]|uniref:hypothetical protein n=1 Tax=Succinivibrio sp. TaxID=2053619 RepID=UPI0025D7CC26|nr:hypothetical protein [Succinivibrio sp.]MBQ9219658.1 hypothetical protein [Succinivibrio sp.]